MSKIVWDQVGQRLYETGVKNGVLYVRNNVGVYPLGVAWNGLTAVTESPTGAESNKIYADDGVYLNLISVELFEGTVEAYTYPDEFASCDGSAAIAVGVFAGQQTRDTFGLCYRTALGNDTEGNDHGYKIHLIYGATAAPSEKAYATINDSPEAITFSWGISTIPVELTGFKPTASLTIDSTKVDSGALATLLDILYGTDVADAYLPLPDEVAALFAGAAPSALALSSIVPTDNATGIAVNSNVVLTFNNKILHEAVIITDDTGAIVAGTKTFDVTGKILTFNPTVDLDSGTVYLVTIGGVVDIYNQSLAPSVKNFSTI